jgi:hypothetical protein
MKSGFPVKSAMIGIRGSALSCALATLTGLPAGRNPSFGPTGEVGAIGQFEFDFTQLSDGTFCICSEEAGVVEVNDEVSSGLLGLHWMRTPALGSPFFDGLPPILVQNQM